MADVYFLSDADRRFLLDLAGRVRAQPGNYQNREDDKWDSFSGDVYVARTPPDGIDALVPAVGTGDVDLPGYADCSLYQIVRRGTPDAEIILGPAKTAVVHNLSTTAIAGDKWLTVVRDKFGTWLAQVGGGGTGGGQFYAELTDFSAHLVGTGGGVDDADRIVYSWVERVQNPNDGTWEDGTLNGEANAYLVEPNNGFAGTLRTRDGNSAAQGTLVLMRESPTRADTLEFTPVVPQWELYKVTVYTPRVGPPTGVKPYKPPIYTLRLIRLTADSDTGTAGDQWGWEEVSPPFDVQAMRAPSEVHDADWKNEILTPIEVGQSVLARPSPSFPGYYEMVPWGAMKRQVESKLYTLCVECVESSPGVWTQQVKIAFRKVMTAARDRRTFWMKASTAESGLEDNTDDQFKINGIGPET